MPARDRDHEHVRRVLVRDGWTITHDPLRLRWGTRDLYVDLGAERLLAAEKGAQKIAVEIKGFTGPSVVDDLEKAIGQFAVYHDVLETLEPDRVLYLAVSETVYENAFEDPLGQLLLAKRRVKLLIYSDETEVIRQWTPAPPTVK
ncbi:MAG: element excision factor XisH family protein [Byssovorax sp.]